MNWWQVILIILGSIVVGLLVGYFLYYLSIRAAAFFRENLVRQRASRKAAPVPPVVKQETVKPAATPSVRQPVAAPQQAKPPVTTPPPVKQPQVTPPAAKQPEAAPPAAKQPVTTSPPSPQPSSPPSSSPPPKPIMPELISEIENNRRIAAQPWSGTLFSFQTRVWDSNQDQLQLIPANLREELKEAYFDISLANSIVWLATEMGRRSEHLDESYTKLCSGIAQRLSRIRLPNQ